MSTDEHLSHYLSRTGNLPVFGYVDHERFGDPFFETLLMMRLHHHLETQLSLGLDESPGAHAVILPKGGFSIVTDQIGGVALPDGSRYPRLPVPETTDD